FRDAVEARLGRRLERAEQADAEPVTARDRTHLGVYRQRGDGDLYYAGIPLVGGRTTSDTLRLLAELAHRHGRGRLRTTNTQNVILADLGRGSLLSLEQELKPARLELRPAWASKSIIACTGVQFCKLAIAETKNRAASLERHLAENVVMDDLPRISVTGC